jgi:hypothetical protein
MNWTYQNTFVTELPDCVGFVYLITNLTNNRKYIGKKLSRFAKTTYRTIVQKNGIKKKKKIKSTIESDWVTYWSSSDELKKDIILLGEHNFKREILYFCSSKSECSYIEAREQFSRKVLESTEYYNGQISVRVHGSHIKKLDIK